MRSNTKTNTKPGFFRYLQLLPVAAFALLNVYPTPALAFAEQAGWSTHSIVFLRDTTLADTSLLGSFPIASEIPRVTGPLTVGTKLRLLATAYSSTTGQTDASPYRTASGAHVHPGTLAANFLPFGTVVTVNGQEHIVEDHLNSRYDDRLIIDKWFASQAEAFAFGVRVVDMEIVSLP